MLRQFIEYIEKETLFSKDDKILLAVSGGVDSIVMLELFHKAGYETGIAHCNFQLRGPASGADEDFVKNLAGKYSVPFFFKRLNTKQYIKKNRVSVQVAARNQRYRWLEQVRSREEYGFIAVAHHKDDVVETFFINLVRGTGIAGLTGIKPLVNKIVRPLLFTDKKAIEAFAQKSGLEYTTDATNEEDIYSRNKIRHKIIPEFQKINPGFNIKMLQNIKMLAGVEKVYRSHINQVKSILLVKDGSNYKISISKLLKLYPLNPYLFEILSAFSFKSPEIDAIERSLKGTSGKQFLSPDYRLIKDREYMIVEKRKSNKAGKAVGCEIVETQKLLNTPLHLKIINKKKEGFKIPATQKTACLDRKALKFPLKVRKWKTGDSFYPLGMKSKKKLSDFFIDEKIPLNEKEDIFVLESGGDIAWIIGYRIDDRFKITAQTKHIYLIKLDDGR